MKFKKLAATVFIATIIVGLLSVAPTYSAVQTGGDTIREFSDIDEVNQVSTGWVSGGEISRDGLNNALADITAGNISFVDNWSSEVRRLQPEFLRVPFGPFDDVVLTNLATDSVTAFGINRTGGLIQRVGEIDAAERRDFAFIGKANHPNNIDISSVDDRVHASVSSFGTVYDGFISLGDINVSGNKYLAATGAGNELKMQRTAGQIFAIGQHEKTDLDNPNIIDTALDSTASLTYNWEDGSGDWNLNAFPVPNVITDRFDDKTGGVGTPNGVVPTGEWTNQRIFYRSNSVDLTAVYFGSNTYSSYFEAYHNLDESDVTNPDNVDFILRGCLLVRSGATDLSDTTQAIFIDATKTGSCSASKSIPIKKSRFSGEFSLGDQSIPNGAAWTDLIWNLETGDKHNFTHSNSTNPEEIIADTDMMLTISVHALWDAAANRNFQARIIVNGAPINMRGGDDSGTSVSLVNSDVTKSNIRILKGDIIKAQAQHTNGSALDIFKDGTFITLVQN